MARNIAKLCHYIIKVIFLFFSPVLFVLQVFISVFLKLLYLFQSKKLQACPDSGRREWHCFGRGVARLTVKKKVGWVMSLQPPLENVHAVCHIIYKNDRVCGQVEFTTNCKRSIKWYRHRLRPPQAMTGSEDACLDLSFLCLPRTLFDISYKVVCRDESKGRG